MMLTLMMAMETSHRDARKNHDGLDELLSAMAQGDEAALGELYHKTSSAIYGFALSILRHKQDAEDVMQDAYLRFYASAAGYQSQGKPMAWMLTITRNLCLKRLQPGREVPLPEGDAVDTLASHDDPIGRSLDKALLDCALSRLGEEERQIVLMHSLTGLKHREIATILEKPLATVLSKYRRALSKLSDYIKEELS